jgi:hypothetical protein
MYGALGRKIIHESNIERKTHFLCLERECTSKAPERNQGIKARKRFQFRKK